MMTKAIETYEATGIYICPLNQDCERCGRECEGCGILELVDTLGMLKNRILRIAEGICEITEDR